MTFVSVFTQGHLVLQLTLSSLELFNYSYINLGYIENNWSVMSTFNPSLLML